jgi:hypothetical protein
VLSGQLACLELAGLVSSPALNITLDCGRGTVDSTVTNLYRLMVQDKDLYLGYVSPELLPPSGIIICLLKIVNTALLLIHALFHLECALVDSLV